MAFEAKSVEVSANNLVVGYGNTFSLNIPKLSITGRIIALIGHNGSGKSTLLKAILRLLVPVQGEIKVQQHHGQKVVEYTPERHMAFSPETGAVFNDIPVESYLKLWCRIKLGDATSYRRQGRHYLERLHIVPLLSRLGRELSKGERRRVQTTVGFLIQPRLFLFDEPFDGLDLRQASDLAQIIREESEKRCFLISSHQMPVLETLADAAIVLEQGTVRAAGSVSEVCASLVNGAAGGKEVSSLLAAMNYHLLQYKQTQLCSLPT